MTQEQLITIDQRHYRLRDLNDNTQSLLANMRFVDTQLQQHQGQQALAQTAKAAYTRALADNLPEKKAAANKKKDVVTIDGSKYNLEDFNESARAQMINIQFADQEISRLQNLQAVIQTARAQYSQVLAEELKNVPPVQAQ